MKKPDIVGVVSKLEPRYIITRRAVGLVNNINIVLTLKKDLRSSFWRIAADSGTNQEIISYSLRYFADKHFKKLVKAYNLNEVTK